MWFKSHAMFIYHIFDSTTSKVSGPVTEKSQLLLKLLGSQVNACSCGSKKNSGHFGSVNMHYWHTIQSPINTLAGKNITLVQAA